MHAWIKQPIYGGTDFLARRDQFWLPKVVQLDWFANKNWSREPVLAGFSAKICPVRLILGGTNFGVAVKLSDGSEVFSVTKPKS